MRISPMDLLASVVFVLVALFAVFELVQEF